MKPQHQESIPHTCAYCQEELIEPKWNGNSISHTFQASPSRTHEAAANGCAFWAWLTRDYVDETRTIVRHRSDTGVSFGVQFPIHEGKPDQRSPFPLNEANATRIYASGSRGHGKLVVLADEGDPAYNFVVPSTRTAPMHSEENFALARKWMKNCHETHTECKKPETGVVPTRLLEINENSLRLRTSIPGETLRWAALSYCWGGPQPLQTTKDTLAQNLDNIPVSILPKTIQDAITTAREINLKYLWIDCLCIIQDDVDDVSKEISLMPEIYRNATVTISAARARTSNEGFLHDVLRPTPQDLSFRLRFLCPDGQIGSLIFYVPDDILPHHDPIETRAWTLQEHLLSQRLLIFGSRQIWWTCRFVHSNYQGRNFTTYSEIGQIRLQFLNVNVTQTRRYLASIPGNTWMSLVKHYTDRSLTFSFDKLLAISGIAEFYATEMKDRYFAGHFGSSFLTSLLWKRGGGILPRPMEYRVPSWSWAAIDGQIRFEKHRSPTSEDLKVIDCTIGLVSQDAPYGAVTSGLLTLSGRLRQVIWSEARDKLLDPSPTGGLPYSYRAETIPDALPSQATITQTQTPIYCLEICSYDPTPSNPPRRNLSGYGNVGFSQKRTVERSGLPKGILLEKVVNAPGQNDDMEGVEAEAGNIYKRVGLFAFRDFDDLDEDGDLEQEDFVEEVESEKRMFFEGCGVQVIRII
ncbi:hypothetical protein VTL71DRAFT_5049 [Oculimacula yallundae]|uniref:Heterokaryon incompatibility domain-containing protein n=1 Tax=Oculimacula yallundae TaxID=86028 RepID=A0ABR4C1N2_9HELO